jgi:hypothetical protein
MQSKAPLGASAPISGELDAVTRVNINAPPEKVYPPTVRYCYMEKKCDSSGMFKFPHRARNSTQFFEKWRQE